MTSVISLHNPDRRSLWLNMYAYTLMKNLPMCILFLVISFLAMPFVLILTLMNDPNANPFNYSSAPALFLSMFVVGALAAIITGFAMHRHLFSKKAMDVFGALPIKRTSLFTSRYAAGLTILLVPMLLNTMLTAMIAVMSPQYNVDMADTVKQTLTMLLCFVCCYTFTSFIIAGSGTVIDSLISMVIFSVAGPGFYAIFQYLMSQFFFGADTSGQLFPYLSPYASATNIVGGRDVANIIWWTFITAALFAASVLFARWRKPENSGTPYVFRGFSILIKGLTTAAGGLLGGLLLRGVFPYITNVGPLVIGFMIFSSITFVIFEIIVSRGFKKMLIHLPLYAAVVALFFISLFGVIIFTKGFETRLPDPNDIVRIEFSDHGTQDPDNYVTPESIQAIYDMHSGIVEGVKWMRAEGNTPEMNKVIYNGSYNYTYDTPIYIRYHLKNGMSFSREYYVETSIFSEPYERLKAQQEYKFNDNWIFSTEMPENKLYLQYYDVYGEWVLDVALNRERASELVECYKQDVLEETPEQTKLRTTPEYFLMLNGSFGSADITILPHYERSMAFMKKYEYDKSYERNAKFKGDSIVKMYVTADFPMEWASYHSFDATMLSGGYPYFYGNEQNAETAYTYAEITGQVQMEQLIGAAVGTVENWTYRPPQELLSDCR